MPLQSQAVVTPEQTKAAVTPEPQLSVTLGPEPAAIAKLLQAVAIKSSNTCNVAHPCPVEFGG